MSRYGVYPGNTSASTSPAGDTSSDEEDDSEDLSMQAGYGLRDSPPKGIDEEALDPGTCTDESTAKQSTTASTPTFEMPLPPLPPPPPGLDPLAFITALSSLTSGEGFGALQRFAYNAMVENYCSQMVSLYLSPNLPHHIHESTKKDLYRRVSPAVGTTGAFDREEFRGVRETVFEGIAAMIHGEMLNMLQQAPNLSQSIQNTPGRQHEFGSMGLENPEGNEVVRMSSRPQSSENLAPLNFIQANRRFAAGLDRPATSDGRKMSAMPGPSRTRDSNTVRDRRRPDLIRAMSFDHLNRGLGGGPKTPPLPPQKLPRGTTSYTPGARTSGYRTPQPRTPNMQSHPFKPHSFGPAPPPPTREREFPFVPPTNNRTQAGWIPPHIPNISALRASVSLQQQTAQGAPMERSWSVDRPLSLVHPQTQYASQQPRDPLQTFPIAQTSRYKNEFTELAFLGKGGFASVFKVKNILDGREYAIKKVPIRNRHLNGKGDKLDAIFKEIKTLAKLEHQNVVRYYTAWVESANGLWERPVATTWPTLPPEMSTKKMSPRIGIGSFSSENMTLGYGISPGDSSPKDGPVLSEFPILGRKAFIDDDELIDPLKVDVSNAIEDDSMGIQFGDDTTKDSESSESDHELIVPGTRKRKDSINSVASDIEVIPRIPPLPAQIPLPVSPQFPVEYFRERRRSFVSATDKDGNELPYPESYARGSKCYSTVSGSDSGLGEAASPPLQDRFEEIKEALNREWGKASGGENDRPVFEDAESSTSSISGAEDDSEDLTSVDMTKKGVRDIKGKSTIRAQNDNQIALVQADRLARRESDRKEILTLMILMSLHPLTLKEFFSHDSESSSRSNKHQFPLPRGLAINIEHPPHDAVEQKDIYCWHMKCALKTFRGILRGVEYLHSNGIVHRDLKPGNIFININHHKKRAENSGGDGEKADCQYCDDKCAVVPRIGDFGLVADLVDGVRKRSDCDSAAEAGDEDILRGDVVGTALYRPPPSTEHDEDEFGSGSDDPQMFGNLPAANRGLRKRNIICEKTDVYALGIIFFELLYRCATGSERVMCLMNLRDGRKLPADFRTRVSQDGWASEDVADLVGKCVMGMTEPKREDRWSLDKVKKELRGLSGWD